MQIPLLLTPAAAGATDASAALTATSQDGAEAAGLFAGLLAQQLGLSGIPPIALRAGGDDAAGTADTTDTTDTATDLAAALGLPGAGADAARIEPVVPAEFVVPALIVAATEVPAQMPGLPERAVPEMAPLALVRAMTAPEPKTSREPLVPLLPDADVQEEAAATIGIVAPIMPSPVPAGGVSALQSSQAPAAGVVSRQEFAVPAAAIAAAPDKSGVSVPELALAASDQPAADNLELTSLSGEQVRTPPQASIPMPQVVTQVQSPPASVVNAMPVTGTIPQHVSSPAWGDSLGDRVIWMVGQQQQGVELRLNPAALGPLEVKMSISDGQASLSFSTQHVPVREAIEAATPRLREMLAESGISLGSVSVNVGTFAQHQPGEQMPNQARAQAWTESVPATDFTSMLPTAVSQLRHNGMVDIFA